jgi:endogenous inhibitor of DNA gyrase (YacG/DUF329 family)
VGVLSDAPTVDARACTSCGRVQPPDAFYKKRDGGLNPWCKACYRGWYIERSGGRIEKACGSCGATFTVTKRNARKQFCSGRCKQTQTNARLAREREAAKPARTCAHCGGPIGQSLRIDAKYCSEGCRVAAAAKRNPRWKLSERLRKYGLTLEEFDAMMAVGCAICGRHDSQDGRSLAIDHCHASGKPRGVLCVNCNQGLGKFADNPDRLRAAAEYIERNH